MKRIQKLITLVLIFTTLFSSMGIENVAMNENTMDQTNNVQQREVNDSEIENDSLGSERVEEDTTSREEPTGEVSEDTENTQGETTVNCIESEQSAYANELEYLYVDEDVINIPETQNIVVGFKDESVLVESAVLNYRSILSEIEYEMQAVNIVNNTVLFSQEYAENSSEDEYQLESITYRVSGEKSDLIILLSDENIEAGYKVTAEQKIKEEAEKTPEISVYSLDESGNTTEARGDTESIEGTVQMALKATDDENVISPWTNADSANVASLASASRTVVNDKVIVICAGHDSTHVGARGSGLLEEELTYKVAKYCKEELEQYSGVTVYMDRNSVDCAYTGHDSSYCLNQRVKDAAAKGASVFVDVHFNVANGSAHGAEVYYPNISYDADISQDGNTLANKILQQLEMLGLTNRGAKIRNCTTGDTDSEGNLDDYYTTNYLSKQYGMTGIIVEHAFMDNAEEAEKLRDENFLKQLGIADATGIANTYGLTKSEKASIKVFNKDDFEGTCQIKVTGVSGGAHVAIWSADGWQDDIMWTSLSGNGGTIDFNINDYKKSKGIYYVHVYDNSYSQILADTTFRVSYDTGSELKIENIDNKDTDYKITLTFADMPDEVTNVQFPTWCDPQQKDIIWYNAVQTKSGVWESTVPFFNHGLAGNYNVHAYVTVSNGTMRRVSYGSFAVREPLVGTFKVDNYSQEKGSFDIVIDNIVSPSGVKNIQVPVWSASDQSDIKWYNAEKQSNGSYIVHVNIEDHQNHTGNYTIHMYFTANNGLTCFAATSHEVKAAEIQVSAKATSSTEMNYTLKASNVTSLGYFQSVNFAVWSVDGGQDDLIWYGGTKDSNGDWNAMATISNHKTAGKYNVHVYGIVTSGVQKFIGNTTFEVSAVSVGTLKVEKYNQNAGSFDVVIDNVKAASGVGNIQLAVWSASNQSDIKWYNAEKQIDGSYIVHVKISNHNYNVGNYSIHMYLHTNNGVTCFKATSQKVENPKVTVTAKDAGTTESTYKLKAENADLSGAMQSVSFAVWSADGGQDDLIWYGGTKDSNGDWNATAIISNHKTAGKYNVHVYGIVTSGVQKFIGNTTFEVSAVSVGTLKVEKYNQNAGSFDVVIDNVKAASGVGNIQLAVWSASNQSDIKWYNAEKQIDGSYIVHVKISNHNYNVGNYSIHMYLHTNNGVTCFKATSQKVENPKVTVTAKDAGTTESTYKLKAENADLSGAMQSVSFAVWSVDGGQDDLIWYAGTKDSNSDWNAIAIISNHKTAGKYNVHVYGMIAGTQKFIGSTTFEVMAVKANSIKVENFQENIGTYDIVISDITAPSGITKMQVPVWSASDQSDIKWYDAEKQSIDTYVVHVDPIYHNYNSGIYHAHIYVTTGNGITGIAATVDQEVKVTDYYSIMGQTTTTVDQMIRYFESRATYPAEDMEKGGAKDIRTFCQIYYEEAETEGVRAEVAFAQAMKETGFLKFGGIVKIGQFNFAGLGALDGNAVGQCATFPDVRTGVRAQIQHLKAYASIKSLNNACVDPRFSLATRGCAPYVQWLGINENPSGKGWATEKNYGYSIVNNYISVLKQS